MSSKHHHMLSITIYLPVVYFELVHFSSCITKIDLFASPPTAAANSPAVDFFAAPEQVVAPDMKPAEPNIQSVNNSDFFGSFSSHTGSASFTEPTTQSFIDSGNSSNNQIDKTSVPSSNKDSFQVNSGVWADSLSRGLIDLNIYGVNSGRTELKIELKICMRYLRKRYA
ncbi:clathrin interactor EPSIN 1 [Tanacetum coccineum]